MMVGWRDLRDKCKECGDRADFSVEYSNDDLPEGYMRSGTRIHSYCLAHLPEEVMTSRAEMLEEVQKPF